MNSDLKDTNPLAISWHDTTRIPQLNPANILDYFCDRCNPFYQKTCNNEILRMQNRDLDQLSNMLGIEYIVLHVQEPILYVIRKQHRSSPTQVAPLADYYILAGTVYQAPDLQSVLNSRLMTGVHHLISAFDETLSYMKYHPTKGYSWEFSRDLTSASSEKSKEKEKAKARTDFGATTFQRRRVDLLLSELSKKFPPKIHSPAAAADPKAEPVASVVDSKTAQESSATRNEKQGEVPAAAQPSVSNKRTPIDPLGPPSKLLRTN